MHNESSIFFFLILSKKKIKSQMSTFVKTNVIIFIGAPLSGKGTQGQRLAEHLNYAYVSTGDLFRSEVSSGSDLGQQMKIYMERGDLIPDELTEEFLSKKLSEDRFRHGMILDGYPRNLTHLTIFQNILKNVQREILAVVYLNVSKDELNRRRTTRSRADDDEKVFEHRYEVVENETLPLVEYFRTQNLLIEIQSIDNTQEQILVAINNLMP